jgi:ribosome production factor 2
MYGSSCQTALINRWVTNGVSSQTFGGAKKHWHRPYKILSYLISSFSALQLRFPELFLPIPAPELLQIEARDWTRHFNSPAPIHNTAKMMQQPLREIKPKNARTKRFLENKAPQIHENPRTALFLKYSSTSEVLNLAMTDLHSLKRPLGIKFSKKNVIHPFEDPASLEFFSEKNDASMMVFGSHSKKRPHCMTVVRMFDWKVLDMLELMIEPETMRTLSQFKNEKARVGLKPLISFSGSAFESPTENAYTLAKSVLLDLFKGPDVEKLDVEGLQYIMNFSVEEEEDENVKPMIRMRCYLIKTKKAGGSLPKVEVEEMGPRIDFRVGRTKEADTEMLKEAMRKPKGLEVSLDLLDPLDSTLSNHITGQDKEEHRNRHHRRQDRPHPHRQAGPQPAADQEDEGSQAQPRRARRRGRFRRRRRSAQRRRQEGSHRLGVRQSLALAWESTLFIPSCVFSVALAGCVCKKYQMYCCFGNGMASEHLKSFHGNFAFGNKNLRRSANDDINTVDRLSASLVDHFSGLCSRVVTWIP